MTTKDYFGLASTFPESLCNLSLDCQTGKPVCEPDHSSGLSKRVIEHHGNDERYARVPDLLSSMSTYQWVFIMWHLDGVQFTYLIRGKHDALDVCVTQCFD